MIRETKERWAERASGRHYEGVRWSSAARRDHDPKLVAAVLEQHPLPQKEALVLDAPCGTGRLRAAIESAGGRYVGLDASGTMLGEAQGALARGDVLRLPFPDETFDAVVCCRLLHHLSDPSDFRRCMAELTRVSRHLIVASFWDAGSLPALRRRFLPTRRSRRSLRLAHAKSFVRRSLAEAGAEVVSFRHTLRLFSLQTFAVATKLEREVEAP